MCMCCAAEENEGKENYNSLGANVTIKRKECSLIIFSLPSTTAEMRHAIRIKNRKDAKSRMLLHARKSEYQSVPN